LLPFGSRTVYTFCFAKPGLWKHYDIMFWFLCWKSGNLLLRLLLYTVLTIFPQF
jgi:hypothetical protein